MIVGGQTEARAQLSSTIIDYHEPFDQGFRLRARIFYEQIDSHRGAAELTIARRKRGRVV